MVYIDIYSTLAASRTIGSGGINVVIDQRDHDPSVANLIYHVLEVLGIRERSNISNAVFVLGLVHNDRPALCDLGICNDSSDFGNITSACQRCIEQSLISTALTCP